MFKERDDVFVEAIDDGWLVLVPDTNRVVTLDGRRAEAFRLAMEGGASVPDELATPMAGLVELGIVESSEWNRRQVLQLGGAAAAATVASVALPTVAAAGSPSTTPPEQPRPVSADYLVIGGGAGGAIYAGGGAGGVIQVIGGSLPTGSYTVTVGAGGKGKVWIDDSLNGEPGGDSSLVGPLTAIAKGGGPPHTLNRNVSGGSGGGGGGIGYTGAAGTPGQGHDGGDGVIAAGTVIGGGGGGAGERGGDPVVGDQLVGGKGGDGIASTIAGGWHDAGGSPRLGSLAAGVTYVGGGGAGGYPDGHYGGLGKGGRGGGGGSYSDSSLDAYGYAGGGGKAKPATVGTGNASQGLVLLRFPDADASRVGSIVGGTVQHDVDHDMTYVLFLSNGSFTVDS